ncbi:RNA polymerase C-22 sterol desaturase [Orbilia oligospora]|uniref:sterol 22-desaturase n=1 Tax=Orbilia oligospora TaxID=2813651 RepID=A0A4Z0XAV5_ORBOL|nr:RNA polymerase C-22 sterol desaturase [Orbilia oligospora]KAF3095434.1 RNA polymerase C-22 sterol desaturase, variant 2 [Orbilia oligospora]KAF3106364.1 RNA polymerase C-22 sterol desaturase [Orbilia oligospora]KAF3118200.1 RNA polymerase C-22 sterol desaturase [Orbilia oligospora]KAF3118201.1 RNA polymerase C-22 sterol desaturase, variant 2 [Orbilia oligospora]
MEAPASSAEFIAAAPSQTTINNAPLAATAINNILQGASVWSVALTLFAACLIYDQVMYIWRKGNIAGSMFKIPFMGPFLESVYPKFEAYHAKWYSGPLSCVSVFHKFVVLASTRDLARKCLNSPSFARPCVVDIAIKLLRPTNFVFLDGKRHADFRKGLNGLFTRRAMESYLPGQEAIYDRYFKRWVELSRTGKPQPFMPEFRDINVALSCMTFCGNYISAQQVATITENYVNITAALDLVNFPIIIPFTRTWYGKKSADFVLATFEDCAQQAKDSMAVKGAVPMCILDHWVKSMMDAREWERRVEAGEVEMKSPGAPAIIRDFTNKEISEAMFAFLFASQDATSSATTWMFQLLADRPEVLAKVREEQMRVREGDIFKPTTMDLLDNMPYTRAMVKETLRYRPPVLMVPYEVKKDFPVTDTYTVPKGSMVVPTLYPALHDPEVYPEPGTWKPERWIDGDAEKQTKNWLVFGTGPHYCLGQHYAICNLMFMAAKAALHLNWDHYPTADSEKIKIFATIFPEDDCHLVFTPRSELYA